MFGNAKIVDNTLEHRKVAEQSRFSKLYNLFDIDRVNEKGIIISEEKLEATVSNFGWGIPYVEAIKLARNAL